jgi:hypothetical protein
MSKNIHAVGVWTAAEQCAEKNIEIDPWPTIAICARDEGKAIFDEYIQETESAGLDIHNNKTVPIVKINGNVSEDAVNDLIQTLCDQFVSQTENCSSLQFIVLYDRMRTTSQTFV